MGVNDLWSILGPVRESVPLYSLTGKTLAVDLSLWVCEAQHVQAMMGKVTKPHLRNLFFRASSLLRMGVKLVFVMEGEAPKIKAETMSKRTAAGFRGSRTKSAPKPSSTTNTSRGRFKAVLRECAEMLDYLGIPWVCAAGEAEAMCAFLDARGLVDGCITSDGDAFLYGAQTVYRNFNMNTKDPQIDCYKMSRVETELQLRRETLVGLAVLLGCDYIPKGVPGVGKEQALKLIQNLKETTLLQKFSDWRKTASEPQEFAVKKVTHCLVCRHPGSAKAHERSGCVFCHSEKFCQPQDYDSRCPCEWHRTEHARQAFSIETLIKKKTLACDMFPFTEIINEFLVPKDKAVTGFRRRKPNLLLMQKFALDKMEWPKHYTSEKVLVLMTYTELMNRSQGTQSSALVQPVRIYKRRVRNGVSCFEIMWRKPDHYVFPEDCAEVESDVVRTVEEENLFSVAFPDIVQLFHRETTEAKDNKLKKKKPKTEKEKESVSSDGVSDLFAQMSLNGSSHLKPVISSDTITVPESDPGHGSTATLTTCASTDLNGREIQPASDAPRSSFTQQPEVLTPRPQSSLSVSVVIDELHLSSIDWDASLGSFTAAPSPQTQHRKADRQPVNESAGAEMEGHGMQSSSSQTGSVSEPSLMERVRLRNMMKSSGAQNNKQESSRDHTAAPDSKGKTLTKTQLLKNPVSDSDLLLAPVTVPVPLPASVPVPLPASVPVPLPASVPVPVPLPASVPVPVPLPASAPVSVPVPASDHVSVPLPASVPVPLPASAPFSVPVPLPASAPFSVPVPVLASVPVPVPVPVPLKYKFVKPKHCNKPSNVPGKTNKESVCKKSVCRRPGSPADNSDVENQPLSEQRQNKPKASVKPKPCALQKTVQTQQVIKQNRCDRFAISGSDSTTPAKQPQNTVFSQTHVRAQTCGTKSDDDDDDDGTDVSICSPLPLAERLKLKFNK